MVLLQKMELFITFVLWLQKPFCLQAEIILTANRNISTCRNKTFYLQAEKAENKEKK